MKMICKTATQATEKQYIIDLMKNDPLIKYKTINQTLYRLELEWLDKQ